MAPLKFGLTRFDPPPSANKGASAANWCLGPCGETQPRHWHRGRRMFDLLASLLPSLSRSTERPRALRPDRPLLDLPPPLLLRLRSSGEHPLAPHLDRPPLDLPAPLLLSPRRSTKAPRALYLDRLLLQPERRPIPRRKAQLCRHCRSYPRTKLRCLHFW